jgi:UDP-N-acetylmuramoylalanine--D-glutamate ligase
MKGEEYFKNKKVTLMGLGVLGRGVGDAAYIASCGAEVIVTDLKSAEELAQSLEKLSQFSNITYVLGEHRLQDFENRDLIVKAAGVPLDSEHIRHATQSGVPVRMSADLFAEISGVACVGVTGTRGKSTVTHMIYDILKADGKEVLLGGNVRGVSTLALLREVTPHHIAVLELDSWQCHGFGVAKMSPHIAVFTSFMDDHLNYYGGSKDAYLADKAQIFLHQKEGDVCVVGNQCADLLKEKYPNEFTRMSIAESLDDNVTLSIPGEHNRYNAALALRASAALGVAHDTALQALQEFKGVEGRLQLVKEVNGVAFYNDTNATTQDATLAALNSFADGKEHTILIMGGADKKLPMMDLLRELPNKTKRVLLLSGTGTNSVLGAIDNPSVFGSLEGALDEAVRFASTGDRIVLSPAFASFGMFKNEYDRGDQFNALVRQYGESSL